MKNRIYSGSTIRRPGNFESQHASDNRRQPTGSVDVSDEASPALKKRTAFNRMITTLSGESRSSHKETALLPE